MKISLKAYALLAALAVLATSSQADSLKLSQNSNYSVGNGGAFTASNFTGPIGAASYSSLAQDSTGGFLTFCLEGNEYFHPGDTYNYALSFGAKSGGLSGAINGVDGISNATAWLYSEFAKGTLNTVSGFSYTKANLGELQQAIWFLEGELGTNNYLVTAAQTQFGANWNVDNNGALGVQALNLTYLTGGKAQDQLYYHNVPDQGLTVALLGLSLLGLVGFRRKFFSAK